VASSPEIFKLLKKIDLETVTIKKIPKTKNKLDLPKLIFLGGGVSQNFLIF
jgi:hypothetical protein